MLEMDPSYCILPVAVSNTNVSYNKRNLYYLYYFNESYKKSARAWFEKFNSAMLQFGQKKMSIRSQYLSKEVKTKLAYSSF